MKQGVSDYAPELMAHGGSHGEQDAAEVRPSDVVERQSTTETIAPQNQFEPPSQVSFGMGEILLVMVLCFPFMLYRLRQKIQTSQ